MYNMRGEMNCLLVIIASVYEEGGNKCLSELLYCQFIRRGELNGISEFIQRLYIRRGREGLNEWFIGY